MISILFYMNEKIINCNFKDIKFGINCVILSKWAYGIGLMFKKKSKAKPLLFAFNNSNQSIHSLFVNFPFYAIWMDKNFNILEIKKVKPWKFSIKCRREFDYLLEIPLVSYKDFIPSEARRIFGKI